MKKILYWPGMGQSADILKYFKTELSKSYQLDIVNFEYDVGNLEPGKWKILNDKFDWWIGISLGASLLYYSYNYVTEAKRPNRLTIINPFSSREKLSIEKGFDLSKQWNFSPKEKNINVNKIELVASVYDFKIPTYHGIELLNNANSTNKRIVFINSNHTIDKKEEQIELAKILLNEDEKNERFNYCNIYKQ